MVAADSPAGFDAAARELGRSLAARPERPLADVVRDLQSRVWTARTGSPRRSRTRTTPPGCWTRARRPPGPPGRSAPGRCAPVPRRRRPLRRHGTPVSTGGRAGVPRHSTTAPSCGPRARRRTCGRCARRRRTGAARHGPGRADGPPRGGRAPIDRTLRGPAAGVRGGVRARPAAEALGDRAGRAGSATASASTSPRASPGCSDGRRAALVARRAELRELPAGAMIVVMLGREELSAADRSTASCRWPRSTVRLCVAAGPARCGGAAGGAADRGRRRQPARAPPARVPLAMMAPPSRGSRPARGLPACARRRSRSCPTCPAPGSPTPRRTDPAYWARRPPGTAGADASTQLWAAATALALEVGGGQMLGSLAAQHPGRPRGGDPPVLATIRAPRRPGRRGRGARRRRAARGRSRAGGLDRPVAGEESRTWTSR